jgi:hypothetical protein
MSVFKRPLVRPLRIEPSFLVSCACGHQATRSQSHEKASLMSRKKCVHGHQMGKKRFGLPSTSFSVGMPRLCALPLPTPPYRRSLRDASSGPSYQSRSSVGIGHYTLTTSNAEFLIHIGGLSFLQTQIRLRRDKSIQFDPSAEKMRV